MTLIRTSGEDVGLPAATMGNSEVGHQNIGAGRIVYQDFTRINKAHAAALGLDSVDEALGKTDADFFPDQKKEEWLDQIQRAGRQTGFQVSNVNSHTLGIEGIDPETMRICATGTKHFAIRPKRRGAKRTRGMRSVPS